MAGTLLGCGEHRVSLWDRDEQVRLADLDDVTSVEYGRQLDTHSDAVVTVGRNGSCCAALANVRPWRTEMVIHRLVAGHGPEQVWSGPVIEPDFGRADTILTARDRWAWLDKRDIRSTVRASGDLSSVAWALVEHGLQHPDGGLDETGIRRHRDVRSAGLGGRRTWKSDSGTVGSELRTLCQGAVNVTFLGRRMVIFGPNPLSRTTVIQDSHFLDELRVKLDGWSMMTRATVRGRGLVESCGGTDPFYGLLEGEVTDDTITDRADARDMACSEVATRRRPPLVLSVPQGARLATDAPVTMAELVPGVEVPVWTRETCLEVNTDLILTGVKVTDDSGGERVQITLAPGHVLGEQQADFTGEGA